MALYATRMLWPALRKYSACWTWLHLRYKTLRARFPLVIIQRSPASTKLRHTIFRLLRKYEKTGQLDSSNSKRNFLVSLTKKKKRHRLKLLQLAHSHLRRARQTEIHWRRSPNSNSQKVLPKNSFSRATIQQAARVRRTTRSTFPYTRGLPAEMTILFSSQRLRTCTHPRILSRIWVSTSHSWFQKTKRKNGVSSCLAW